LAENAQITTSQVSNWMSHRRQKLKKNTIQPLINNKVNQFIRKELLSNVFKKSTRPSEEMINDLMASTAMTKANILTWFSKQRNQKNEKKPKGEQHILWY
jgi:hypothetical protein